MELRATDLSVGCGADVGICGCCCSLSSSIIGASLPTVCRSPVSSRTEKWCVVGRAREVNAIGADNHTSFIKPNGMNNSYKRFCSGLIQISYVVGLESSVQALSCRHDIYSSRLLFE